MSEELAEGCAPDDPVKQEILNLAEQWARALISNDAQKIGDFMSDDWVIVGQNGITRKQDFLSSVESGDLTHETMEPVGAARVQIYGDTAVLSGRVTNNGHYKGAPFSADEWTTDVFLRREGRWLCVISHITPV